MRRKGAKQMGYIKHNAIVETGVEYSLHKFCQIYDKARELFGTKGVSNMVSSPLNGFMACNKFKNGLSGLINYHFVKTVAIKK